MGKQRPVWERRLGSVRIAIWENSNNGRPWFNVELTRRYKQGSEWKDAGTFNGLADLAQVRLANELAIEWLSARENQNDND